MAINPKDLTIDYKEILKASSFGDRSAVQRGRPELMSSLTPTDLASTFSDNFKKGTLASATSGGGGGISGGGLSGGGLGGGSGGVGGGSDGGSSGGAASSGGRRQSTSGGASASRQREESKVPWLQRPDDKGNPVSSKPLAADKFTPQAVQGQGPTISGDHDLTSRVGRGRAVYDSLRRAGFPDEQARSLTAEANREMSLKAGAGGNQRGNEGVFGTHPEPALNRATGRPNGRPNYGLMSWGDPDRVKDFREYMTERGVDIDKMEHKQEVIDHQSGFLMKEFKEKYPKQFNNFMNAKTEGERQQALRSYIRYVPDAAGMKRLNEGSSLIADYKPNETAPVAQKPDNVTNAAVKPNTEDAKVKAATAGMLGPDKMNPDPKPMQVARGVNPGGIIPQPTAEEQKNRPGYYSGNINMGEYGTFRYGTGSPGRLTGGDMSGGSSPYGTADINSGLHGSRNPAFNKNSFAVANTFDPKWGRDRVGVLFHSASDMDRMYSAGCFAVSKDQWPEFKASMMKMMQEKGPLQLHVSQDGSVHVFPKGNPPAAISVAVKGDNLINPAENSDKALRNFGEGNFTDLRLTQTAVPANAANVNVAEQSHGVLDASASRQNQNVAENPEEQAKAQAKAQKYADIMKPGGPENTAPNQVKPEAKKEVIPKVIGGKEAAASQPTKQVGTWVKDRNGKKHFIPGENSVYKDDGKGGLVAQASKEETITPEAPAQAAAPRQPTAVAAADQPAAPSAPKPEPAASSPPVAQASQPAPEPNAAPAAEEKEPGYAVGGTIPMGAGKDDMSLVTPKGKKINVGSNEKYDKLGTDLRVTPAQRNRADSILDNHKKVEVAQEQQAEAPKVMMHPMQTNAQQSKMEQFRSMAADSVVQRTLLTFDNESTQRAYARSNFVEHKSSIGGTHTWGVGGNNFAAS